MTLDAIIIGGGPAGLQAALTLGRMHLDAVLLDAGRYRNDPAAHSHNMLTRDGVPPAELRAIGRDQLRPYPTVAVREVEATHARAEQDRVVVTLADGEEVVARRLLLATGVRDSLPDVPGLEPLFGSLAAHCPYCHGHEMAGRRVAVLGAAHVADRVRMLWRITDDLVVLTHGAALEPEDARDLAALGVAVRTEAVEEVRGDAEEGEVRLAGGDVEVVGGILVATTFAQSAPFAEQLGLELLSSGGVRIDALGHTSHPLVYAAGDLAHAPELPMPMSSVLTAAAAGLMAASALHRELPVEAAAPESARVSA